MPRNRNSPARNGRALRLLVFFALPVFAAAPLAAEEPQGGAEDPTVFIGFSLRELVEIRGAPEGVYAVRGNEDWQDDVVFRYGGEEFYFYRDRVWQIGVKSAFGIRAGDRRETIPLVMGEVRAEADHSLAVLSGRAWPLTVRFNVDARSLVTGIYIYRSDF